MDTGRSHRPVTITTPPPQVFSADLLARLRDGLLQYAERCGLEFRKVGATRFGTRCPFHDDHSPSATVYQGKKGPLFGCYPCGWSGDVFEFAKKLGRANDFRSAVEDVASALGVPLAYDYTVERVFRPKPEPVRRRVYEPEVPPLPEDFEERHRAARARLWGSPEFLRRAGEELGIPPEIIREFCYTTDALGWAEGKLLYLYETGAKVRNPKGVLPRFKWHVGKAVRPWRWHFAARPEVRRIYVTEGESDAVAAYASGLENLHPKGTEIGSAVVASPGTSFPQDWGPLFRGKHVVFLFDADEAGRKAAERASEIVHPFAASVRIGREVDRG